MADRIWFGLLIVGLVLLGVLLLVLWHLFVHHLFWSLLLLRDLDGLLLGTISELLISFSRLLLGYLLLLYFLLLLRRL